jgi:hypothetical protein
MEDNKRQKLSNISEEQEDAAHQKLRIIDDVEVRKFFEEFEASTSTGEASTSTADRRQNEPVVDDEEVPEEEEEEEEQKEVKSKSHEKNIEVLLAKLCPSYIPIRDIPLNTPIKILHFNSITVNSERKISVMIKDGRQIILPDRFAAKLTDGEITALNKHRNLYFTYYGLKPMEGGVNRSFHDLIIFQKRK